MPWFESVSNALRLSETASYMTFLELGFCLMAAILCPALMHRYRGSKVRSEPESAEGSLWRRPLVWLDFNAGFVLFTLVVGLALLIANFIEGVGFELQGIFFLSLIWILLGLLSSFLKERFWQDSILIILYGITALYFLQVTDPIIEGLSSVSFQLGEETVTAWGIFAGLVTLILTLWLALAVARLAENRITRLSQVNPSLQVLIIKTLRIGLLVVALVIAISSMGVDLTALTVFGGAIGLGLGFGLQKVVSNLVCGFVLLTDRSIKPGDVIEIADTYGWINNLRGRYVSVITRDGTEHLIPNEDLVTHRVVNWSFTNNLVRIRTAIGISYDSDPHLAIRLIKEVAENHNRVIKEPPPAVLVKGFGDSSVDLELRCWIADPVNGVGNVRSQILLDVWDIFKEHGITIPYPQRDLHIRSDFRTQAGEEKKSPAQTDGK